MADWTGMQPRPRIKVISSGGVVYRVENGIPLPLGTGWDAYAPALDAATTVIRRFGPDGLVVSLGVDTAAEDYDTFQLVGPDFARMGEAIGALGLPTVLVQEGGYDLGVIGRNVVAVLRGVEDAYGSS